MPTDDVFYGADSEMRIGIMADANTDPTAWQTMEFIQATFSPQRERRVRAKLGSPRNNALDPIKPIPGFERLSADIVTDADSRQTPRWLRNLLGAPTTTGPSSGIYTHVFASGSKTAALCAIQVRTGAAEIRIYRGLTLGALSLQASGEQTRDYDLSYSMRGLSRARAADWLTGTVAAVPAEAPISRTLFRADGVAAANTLDAQWSWDRQLAEDVFLSPTARISGVRPNGGALTGRARFRAVGAAFDTIEEGDTIFAPDLQMLGVVASHEIKLEHPHAQLNAPPLAIGGPGLMERTFDWFGFQDASTPGARITIKNDVASFAT
jgi:hypothetical protein